MEGRNDANGTHDMEGNNSKHLPPIRKKTRLKEELFFSRPLVCFAGKPYADFHPSSRLFAHFKNESS